MDVLYRYAGLEFVPAQGSGNIIIKLSTGIGIFFSPHDARV